MVLHYLVIFVRWIKHIPPAHSRLSKNDEAMLNGLKNLGTHFCLVGPLFFLCDPDPPPFVD